MDNDALIGFWTRMDQFVKSYPYMLLREGIRTYLVEHPDDKPFFVRAESHLANSDCCDNVSLAEWHTGQKDTIYVMGMLGGLVQDGLLRGLQISDICRCTFQWLQECGYKISRWAITDVLTDCLHDSVEDSETMEKLGEMVAHFADLSDNSDDRAG